MIEYVKGPLGFAILCDGRPAGHIKDYRPHGFLLKISGHSWAPRPGSIAAQNGVKTVPVRNFDTLAEAKAEAERVLK